MIGTPTSPRRSRPYAFLIGVLCGVVVTGLVLPMVVGERPPSADAGSAGPAAIGLPGDDQLPDATDDGVDRAGTPRAGSDAASSPSAGQTPQPAITAAGESTSTPTSSSEVGVTPDAVKVGFLLTDLGNPTGLAVGPGVSVEEQQQQWQAYVDELNERGGVAGRRVQPVYRNATILDKDQMRATCIRLAKDDKVFAVLDAGGAAIGELPQCYTAEHGLPLLAGGAAGLWDDAFASSRGLLFVMHQRGSRLMRSFAAELDRVGRLRGKTCGILADQFQGASPRGGEALEAELEARGCKVAHRETLSADLSTGSSQIPLAVQQMRGKGVNAVMLLANPVYATQFVQGAQAQAYQPEYNLTDWLGGVTDFAVQNMPPEFDGSVGVTSGRIGEDRANMPEAPEAAACRQIYERRVGEQLDRSLEGYTISLTACSELELFARAAAAVSPNLTRSRFATALAQTGTFVPAYQSRGSFSPGKPDLADGVRTVVARTACGCWHATGAFHEHR